MKPFCGIFFSFLLAFTTSCVSVKTFNTSENTKVHTLYSNLANVHFLEQNGKLIMIDSGGEKTPKKILKALKKIGLSPDSISAIIITHGHADHAGGVSYFIENFQTPVFAGNGDRIMVTSGATDTLCPTNLTSKILMPFLPKTYKPFVATPWIEEKTSLSGFGFNAEIIPLAGHTQGSIMIKTENIAFVGDLVRGKPLKKSKPATHFYQCDISAVNQQIELLLKSDIETYFLGHFGPVCKENLNQWFLNQKP